MTGGLSSPSLALGLSPTIAPEKRMMPSEDFFSRPVSNAKNSNFRYTLQRTISELVLDLLLPQSKISISYSDNIARITSLCSSYGKKG
jgi:hypothetical protein